MMYKGKYLIAICSNDKYELCEALFDSILKFSQYVGCSLNRARVVMSLVHKHKLEYVVINGRFKKVELIEEI